MPKKATTESTTTAKEDLNIAITMLILDLKGDGTVSSLADQIHVPRKTLSLALRTCQDIEEKKMSSSKYFELKQKEGKPEFPPTKILWELTSLIWIADTMGIRVSDLIHAAEDVQDGLPPWFQYRISWNTTPRTQNELANIFLEAVGCRTYGPYDPLGIIGKRKSLRGSSEDSFSEKDVSNLRFLADCLFEHKLLEEFVKMYHAGKISSKEAYLVLKKAVDYICNTFKQVPLYRHWKKQGNDRNGKAINLLEHLRTHRPHLIDAISCECRPLLQKEVES